ncbi:MAG: hypothetical protein C0451_04750 [Comamonadaceae bacterium]|nr:hypothetical protein [Comamonadaceae bacterium]
MSNMHQTPPPRTLELTYPDDSPATGSPDLPRLHELARQELDGLAEHNCARWRMGLREVQQWIGAGRPQD